MHPAQTAGDIVRARWGDAAGGILLLCHMDTVWDLGTLAAAAVRIEDGRLYGPGAFDMKGGIVNALWAMRALRELGLMPSRRITLLITAMRRRAAPASRGSDRGRGVGPRGGLRSGAGLAPASARSRPGAKGPECTP